MSMRPSPNARTASLSIERVGFICCLAWVFVLGAGCRGPEVYQAADLPQEFHAPSRFNAKTADLSAFGQAPAGGEIIHRGDVLEVSIAAGLSADDRVTIPTRVHDNGNVRLPEIGQIPVAGLELKEAEDSIHAASVQLGLYRNPLVTITRNTQRTCRVTVLGAVKKPGIYHLPAQTCDLLAAVGAAGGLAEDAGTEVEIHLPKTDRPAHNVDAVIAAHEENTILPAGGSVAPVPGVPLRPVQISLAADPSTQAQDFAIPDGAMVTVMPRPPEFFEVIGLVNRPHRFEFPLNEEVHVLDAIALAEGLSIPMADKVHITRQLSHQTSPVVIEVSLRGARKNPHENLRLAAGDIVSVEQTQSTMLVETFRGVQLNVQATGH